MKNIATRLLTTAATILFAGVFIVGCDNGSEPAETTANATEQTGTTEAKDEMRLSEEAKQHAKQALSEAKTAAELGWESFTEFSKERKEQAASFLDRKADQLDVQLDELRARADQLAGESKAAYQASLDELRDERAELEVQIEKLKDASGENWEEAKEETKQKWNELIDRMQAFSERLKTS